jgi:hypothetical protein
MLNPNQTYIDPVLTNLTVAQLQSDDNFIADKVFPNVPVDKQSGKYYVWPRGQFNRVGDVKKLAPGVASEVISLTVSQDNYFAEVFALGMYFNEQELANVDTQLNVRLAGSVALANRMRLKREQDWLATYFAPGVWTTQYTGVASAPTASQVVQWNDYVNSTPIQNVTRAKTALFLASGGTAGYSDIVAVMTQDVYDVMVNHPDILSRLNGGSTVTNTALVTQQKLAEVLGVAEILIPRAIANTGKEGLADVNGFMATKKFGLFARPKTPGLMVAAAGYNFTWSAGTNAGFGIDVNSYTGEYLRIQHIVEKLEVVNSWDMKVVSPDMAVYFDGVIA